MTALKQYQKLEGTGLWRDTPEAQRREVVVAFGEASLVLKDPRTESPLAHWSLPAVLRLNPGENPALYAPDTEADETLELDDATMIGAIETVRGAIAAARPKPGRLRSGIVGGIVLAGGLLAVFWLPQALVTQTAAMVPAATRAGIGRMALTDLTRLTGVPCAAPLGLRSATKLSDRVFGPGGDQVLILRDGIRTATHLPGGLVLLARGLVENHDGPAVAAGFAIAEKVRATQEDPLVPLLRHAGLLATLRLLTTGSLPEAAVTGYAETLLIRPADQIPDSRLLAAFEAAGVPSTPYAYALDSTGETVLGLIEADPFRSAPARPVLADDDWVSLQSICQD